MTSSSPSRAHLVRFQVARLAKPAASAGNDFGNISARRVQPAAAPGGEEATRNLLESIGRSVALVGTTRGRSRHLLQARLTEQVIWFARVHPGRVHALQAYRLPRGNWLVRCAAFGLGRLEIRVCALENLSLGFHVSPAVEALMYVDQLPA